MEGRISAWVAAGLVVVTLLAGQGSASARGREWDVDTDPDGINVDIGLEDLIPGGGGGSGGGGGGGASCRLIPAPPGYEPRFVDGDPNRPLVLYVLTCDGVHIRPVWVDVNRPGGARIRSPREIAEEVRRRIPVPHNQVGINPNRGLTGLASWFWVAGPPPASISQTITELGVSVTVTATLSEYRWHFGDGTTISTLSVGQAYPSPSDIKHVYERASSPGSYTVTLDFVYNVSYQVAGGPVVALAPIVRSVTRAHEVIEIRSQLISSGLGGQ